MPAYGTFKYGQGKYGTSWTFPFYSTVGSYRGHRFTVLLSNTSYATDNINVHDKSVESNSTIYLRYLSDNMIVKLDPAVDYLFIYLPYFDDLQSSNSSYLFLANQNASADKLHLTGEDFLDGKKICWSVGLIPFDSSLLYKDGYDVAGGSGQDATYSGYSGSGGTYTDAQDEIITWAVGGLPVGSYRCYFRSCVIGTGVYNFDVDVSGGSDTISATSFEPVKSATPTAQWYNSTNVYKWLDFYSYDSTTSTSITFKQTDATTDKHIIDEAIIIPMSNGKNFCLDIKNRAHNQLYINEGIE